MKTAYEYVIMQTKKYLQEPLPSTGLRPHISVAAEKATQHRDTNHAILLILPVDGVCVAMPLDAPLVYSVSEETHKVEGGCGQDLAKQVVTVLHNKLEFGDEDMNYIRGTLVQYINNTVYNVLFHCLNTFL